MIYPDSWIHTPSYHTVSYCWWLKSCTTWWVVFPIIYKIFTTSQVVQDFFHQQYHCIFWEFLQQKSCQHQIQQAFLQIRSKVWSAGRSWCLDDNRPRRKIPNQNDGSFRKDMSDRSSGSMLNLPYLPRCTCSICKQSPSIAFLYKCMIMYRYIVSVYI